MAVDGSLIFDTRIDTKNFHTGRKSISNAETLGIGSVYQGELNFTLRLPLSNMNLYEAKVLIDFGLELSDGSVEWVPLGVYYIEEAEQSGNSVKIKALDSMSKLDIPTGITTGQTYTFEKSMTLITQYTGVEFAQTFDEVEALTSVNLWQFYGTGTPATWRDVLREMAELICGFAYINREGKIEFKTLDNTTPVAEITANRRHSLTLSNRLMTVDKIQYTTTQNHTVTHTIKGGGTTIYFGNNGLMMDSNQSQDGKYKNDWVTNTLSLMAENLKNIDYVPGTVEYAGDPSLDIGDYVLLTGGDADDTLFFIGTDNWIFRGIQTLTAPGVEAYSGGGYSGGSYSGGSSSASVTSEIEYLKCSEKTGFTDNGLAVCEIEFKVSGYSTTVELSGDTIISTEEKSTVTAQYFLDDVAEVFTPKNSVDGYSTLHLNHVFSVENGQHNIKAILTGIANAEQCEAYLIGQNIILVPIIPTSAEDYVYIVEDTVTLLNYIGSDERIQIPDTIENTAVTVIETTCFTYSDVTEVVIPDGVTTIN